MESGSESELSALPGGTDGGKFESWLKPMEDGRSFVIARTSAPVLRILTRILTNTMRPSNPSHIRNLEGVKYNRFPDQPKQIKAENVQPSFAHANPIEIYFIRMHENA